MAEITDVVAIALATMKLSSVLKDFKARRVL
jgi:hypothetical protein